MEVRRTPSEEFGEPLQESVGNCFSKIQKKNSSEKFGDLHPRDLGNFLKILSGKFRELFHGSTFLWKFEELSREVWQFLGRLESFIEVQRTSGRFGEHL